MRVVQPTANPSTHQPTHEGRWRLSVVLACGGAGHLLALAVCTERFNLFE